MRGRIKWWEKCRKNYIEACPTLVDYPFKGAKDRDGTSYYFGQICKTRSVVA